MDFLEARLTVVPNLGGGLFGEPSFLGLDAFARDALLADLDEDGQLDLACVEGDPDGTGRGMVFLGDGEGWFGAPLPFEATLHPAPFRLESADVNEDGHLDLAAAFAGDATGAGKVEGAVVVYLGDGSGDFAGAAILDLPAGGPLAAAAAGDLNEDGHTDLLLGGVVNLLLLGDGRGGFAPAASFVTPIDPGVRLADVDRDGHMDLLSTHPPFGLAVLPGDGTGRFRLPDATPGEAAAGAGGGLALGDLNGDGVPDAAAILHDALDGGWAQVYLGNGTGGLVPGGATRSFTRPRGPALADADGDGDPDLLFAAGSAVPELGLYLARGDGKGGLGEPEQLNGDDLLAPILAGDLDRDGVADLVARTPGGVAVYRGDGAGGFPLLQNLETPSPPGAPLLGDFDRDGVPDLVLPLPDLDLVSVHFGRGDGGFGPARSIAVPSRPVAAAASDLDGDGALDVVVAGSASRDLTILLGDGEGGFRGSRRTGIGRSPCALLVTDLDEEGVPDLLVRDDGGDTLLSLRWDVSGGRKEARDFGPGFLSSALGLADLDRDGHADVVTFLTQGGRTRPVVLRNASLDDLDCRGGNVDGGAPPPSPANVLFVNGVAGEGRARMVQLGPADPFEIRMELPPALRGREAATGAAPRAPFVLYAWRGVPAPSTVETLPGGWGRICLGTPVGGGLPSPDVVWNNTGRLEPFGPPTLPSRPAPSVVYRTDPRSPVPSGVGIPATFFLQGLVLDPRSPSGRFAVTNGIQVVIR